MPYFLSTMLEKGENMNLKKLFALIAVAFVMQSAHAAYRTYRGGRYDRYEGRRGVYVAPTPVYANSGEVYADDAYYNRVGVGAGVDSVGAGVEVGDGVGAGVEVGPIGVGAGVGIGRW